MPKYLKIERQLEILKRSNDSWMKNILINATLITQKNKLKYSLFHKKRYAFTRKDLKKTSFFFLAQECA